MLATKRRDRRAALKVLKRPLKHYDQPGSIVTDRLCSYGAAMKAIGIVGRQDVGVGSITGRKLTSAVPTKRGCDGQIQGHQQKFAAVHASIHNHFHQDRHLNRRNIFKQNRSVALAEWRRLAG